jgi:hypothetical protein
MLGEEAKSENPYPFPQTPIPNPKLAALASRVLKVGRALPPGNLFFFQL